MSGNLLNVICVVLLGTHVGSLLEMCSTVQWEEYVSKVIMTKKDDLVNVACGDVVLESFK